MKRLFRKKPSWGKLPRQVRVRDRELPFVCKVGSKRACDRSVHPPHTHAGRQQNSPLPSSSRLADLDKENKSGQTKHHSSRRGSSVRRASVRRLRNCLRGQRPPSIMNGPVIPSETSGIKQKWNTKKKPASVSPSPGEPDAGEAPCCVRRARRHDSAHSSKRFKEKGTHNIN